MAAGKLILMITQQFVLACLLSALLYPLLFSPLCHGAPSCPNCGNVTVPYPLSTSSSCGDQQYRVVCNVSEGRLSLNTLSGSYPILRITPSSQRLVIGSPAIAPDSCATTDLGGGGFVLDPSAPFNVTSSNTILLLNCSQKLLFSPLNCTARSLCSQFLAQDNAGKPCMSKLCCTFTAGGSSTSHKIGIEDGDCTAYVSVLGLDPSKSAQAWNYGMELEWAAPLEPVCSSQRDCGMFSTCQRDAMNNVSRCLCNENYQWDGFTGTCADDAFLCSNFGTHCGKKQQKAPLIAGIVVGAFVCGVVVVILAVVHRRRRAAMVLRASLTKQRQEILSEGGGGRSAKLYTSQDMKRATQNFSKDRLLGSGGFGDVYKGILVDGSVVAVKSAKVGNIKGVEQVLNEVRVLSQVNHRGLVMLLGCCVETEQPLLVYEYVPNGTLSDHLRGSRGGFLDWRHRLRVAVQTAEGLSYLHSAANPPIYHRDVKSSNILLDAELNAKVSDFGLSRLAQADLSHISTCAQGTLGYLDPEYYRNYQLTAKSDVYSFGVVLLELVTSQKAIEFSRGQDDVNLAVYVAGKAQAGRIMDVVDPRLLGRTDNTAFPGLTSADLPSLDSSSSMFDSSSTAAFEASPAPLLQTHLRTPNFTAGNTDMVGEAAVAESIYKVAYLALSCLQDSRADRPSMKEVSEELQYSLQALDAALGLASGGDWVARGGSLHAGSRARGLIAAVPVDADHNQDESAGQSSSGFTSSASTINTASMNPHVIPR